jgi:hypothetical protein
VIRLVSALAAVLLALPAAAQTKRLGTAGGWAVSQVYAGGKFVRCVADTTGGARNEGLRLSFAADGKRQFIMPGAGTANGTREDAHIVLQPSGRRFGIVMTQSNPDRLWSANLLQPFVDVLFESKRMEVTVPARNIKRVYSLGNPDVMTAAVDGCLTSNQ